MCEVKPEATKSPNRQIAKSPNRQIAKSPNRQIAKSPNRQTAILEITTKTVLTMRRRHRKSYKLFQNRNNDKHLNNHSINANRLQ